MFKQKIVFNFLVIICCVNSLVGQVRMLKFKDFKEPKGEWFTANSVQLDSTNKKEFIYQTGVDNFLNGITGKTKHLETEDSFGDIELHLEFLLPKGSNSGIYFQSRYEIQIFDSYGKQKPEHSDCGGIYQRWEETRANEKKGYEGKPPRVNASLPLGEWQSFDIIFRAPRFDGNGTKIKNAYFEKVILNGIVVHQNKEVTGPTREGLEGKEVALAPLRLQGDHGKVAFRNIRIRSLENTQSHKKNTWVNLFEKTKSGSNYDVVVHGNFTQKEANTMFDFNGNELKAMYEWKEDSAPYGVVITKKRYSSYDLKLEFKWGNRRFKPRMDKVRDAGLLYHCQAGTYVWPPSLEYQIQEGDCGDLWNILGCHSDVLKDGQIISINKRKYSRSKKWINAEKESWNTVVLEVREDKARYYLNGILVNEVTNATYGGLSCKSGFIALQAEYSEITYRNIMIKEITD